MAIIELLPEWDESNEGHIARHGISPDEVEEVVYESFATSFVIERQRRARRGEIRWVILGKSCSGRMLHIVIAPRPEQGVWRCVSAREMEQREKRFYRLRSK